MQEAASLPCHRVLVTACEIKGAARDLRQIGRTCHEAVIAVDYNKGFARRDRLDQSLEISRCCLRSEEHLAYKDEVMLASPASRMKAFGEGLKWLGGYSRDSNQPILLQALELTPRGVELGIARQDANGPIRRKTGQQPAKEFASVGCNGDSRRVRQLEVPCDPGLDARDQFTEHQVPFFTGEPGRVLPALLLRCECHVGPVMVTVRRKVDPLRRRGAKLREMIGKIEYRHVA